jgi:outer membrane protein assembly factor BamB
MMRFLLLISALTVAFRATAETPQWPCWRGPAANGSTEQGTYPVKWDPTNVLWKAPLPGKGCSTPIVWNQRVFLTTPIKGMDGVMAFDWNGQPLWQTELGPENAGKHRNGSGSNPSPATDGKIVSVYFKSGTLAALDFDGKVRWQTNLVAGFGPDTLFWDQGTSPVLTKDSVIITRMHGGDSWLAAFDKATGQMRWKTLRNYETPTEGDNAYTTPLVIDHHGKEALLIWGAHHVTAHETSRGELLWFCGNFNPKGASFWPSVASPVLAGDVVVVACGRADRGDPRLHGVRLGGAGEVTATHRIWNRDDIGTFVPTPAEYKRRIYLLRDRGELECLDPATGKSVWRDALPKAGGSFYASPTVANGLLYAIREDGMVFVARVEPSSSCCPRSRWVSVIASPVPVSIAC